MATSAPKNIIQSISNVLKNTRKTSKIRFKVNNINIYPERLKNAGKALENGKIKVQINPLIPHYGQYDVNKNILTLKHSNLALNSAVVQSFFIHEGVHMGNDVDKIGIVKGVDEEAAGFIAQAIYFRAETGRYLSDPDNNPKINKVFSQANAAAISVINKSSTDIYNINLDGLRAALNDVNIYRTIVRRDVNYNGV